MLVAYDLKLKYYSAIFLESGYRLQRSNLQLWSNCGIDCILIVWVRNLSSQCMCGPVLLEGKVGIWWPHKGVWLAYSGYSMGSLGLGAAGQMGCAVAEGPSSAHSQLCSHCLLVTLLPHLRLQVVTFIFSDMHVVLHASYTKIHQKAKPKQRHCNSPIGHPS